METTEVEFIAECYNVKIVPKFNHPAIHLISGDLGPFMAGMPISVPLWAALNLRQQHKCRILPPDWMNVAELERLKQEEKESQVFTKIPTEHYREITHLLVDVAGSDLPQAEEVQTLVKDLWDIRLAKLRASTDVFIKSDQVHAQVDHLTMMELNSVRPLLLKSLRHISQLTKVPQGQNSSVNESGTISISVASADQDD
ncbi:DNA replication complex GINS protein PSF2-like [Varroa jacobsoni]|uniref:DNA replication complex GINS protein PSF2 n=1 Tax=Varroa destructor TaxID=109461 RepID=A0A7M7KJ29_VARDE|nr:DNA replication complex GINS protein PSF2-like [Varroa destructor]XP_022698155.1 DNA replication complex GINS protein PSF2-like [Varroa jacobsoni]